MKERTEIKSPLIGILRYVVIALLILSSCNREDKEQGEVPGRIIPEKAFISLLKDLYMTDGLLSSAQVRDEFPDKDSLDTYIDVIRSHGYTKADIDSTIKHYYFNRPKRLIKIYDRILAEFTETEARLSNNPEELAYFNNEWKGPEAFYFPGSDQSENPEINIPLRIQAYFSLTFRVTVFPYDQSRNPGYTLWFVNADSAETGKKYYLPGIRYIKDGQPHTYNINQVNLHNFPVILKGTLYDVENNPLEGIRYGSIDNIQLITSGGIL